MEFFDKLGKKASQAAKVTADKTGKIAKETKLKFKIGELKTQINDIYEEIGKKVYEKHVREEDISIKKDLEIMLENNIVMTIGTPESAKFLNEMAKRKNMKAHVHLKVDTGFSRYGFWYTEKEKILDLILKIIQMLIINMKMRLHCHYIVY